MTIWELIVTPEFDGLLWYIYATVIVVYIPTRPGQVG